LGTIVVLLSQAQELKGLKNPTKIATPTIQAIAMSKRKNITQVFMKNPVFVEAICVSDDLKTFL
jgi:hypothetical protein